MQGRTVLIIGGQSETQECIGPFDSVSKAFEWVQLANIDEARVSHYEIITPEVWETRNHPTAGY